MATAVGPAAERELVRIVGHEHVRSPRPADLVDASEVSGVRGTADAVILPGSSAQVAEVVGWCYEHQVPMTPRGGATGFAGGAVPQGGVVIDLGRLNRIRSLDPGRWRMEAEAGVTTATVARRAREVGLFFAPDPGAAESSQIGGNLATNAGGPHTFKYGVTRAWVTGVEAVLAPGELVQIGGATRKDVAGYDLVSLLVGSEGTLGIITAAWLRLIPAPECTATVIATFPDARAGCDAMERVLVSGVVPAVIEYLDETTMRAAPLAGVVPGFALVVEVDGTSAEAAAAMTEIEDALQGALSLAHPKNLWQWRGGVSFGVSSLRGGKLSEDVVVPLDRLADAIEFIAEVGERHGLEACSWGHAGDGNLHATFLLDPGDAALRIRADAAADDLFARVIELGGSVSGEHGLGLLKCGQLRHQWGRAAVGAHQAVKAALDPQGLFNPGKKMP